MVLAVPFHSKTGHVHNVWSFAARSSTSNLVHRIDYQTGSKIVEVLLRHNRSTFCVQLYTPKLVQISAKLPDPNINKVEKPRREIAVVNFTTYIDLSGLCLLT